MCTARSSGLLEYLILHCDRVLPHEKILQKVWQRRREFTHRGCPHRLAAANLDQPQNPKHIQTVRGRVYKFLPSSPRIAPAAQSLTIRFASNPHRALSPGTFRPPAGNSEIGAIGDYYQRKNSPYRLRRSFPPGFPQPFGKNKCPSASGPAAWNCSARLDSRSGCEISGSQYSAHQESCRHLEAQRR